VNGVLVQFAFFFNLDGDPGCDAQDSSNTHSQGLEALANVSGHELSEALTDPHGDAWYDRKGAENADKCAWTFNGSENLAGRAGRSRATGATLPPTPTPVMTERAASTATSERTRCQTPSKVSDTLMPACHIDADFLCPGKKGASIGVM
jgi:hypothetical protein